MSTTEEEVKSFWIRTNALIKKNKTTQQELSLQCGFLPRRIQSLSAENRKPSVFEAYSIAKALNTTIDYLVTGIDHTSDNNEPTKTEYRTQVLIQHLQDYLSFLQE